MKAIRKLLIFFMATGLALAAAAWAIAGTAMNAEYLKSATVKADLAGQLARTVPAVLAAKGMRADVGMAGAGVAAGEFASSSVKLLQDALNRQFMQGQIDSLIDEGIEHFTAGAGEIKVDLRDIRPQLLASGVALNDEIKAMLEAPQPLPLGGIDAPLTAVAAAVKVLQWAALLAAVAFGVLLFLLGGHRRFSALAKGLTGGAVGALLFAGAAWLPAVLIGLLLSAPPGKEFAPAIGSVLTTVAGDQSIALMWMAGGMIALAAVLFFAQAVLGRRKKDEK